MLAKRIIPCLDIKDGRVVKGVSFVNLRDAGDPVDVAKVYEMEQADEVVFLDITASHEKRDIILDVARRTSEMVFMPLTIGGGIRHIADILVTYLSHVRRNDSLLLEYAHKLGNRSVFKRLGYLLQAIGADEKPLIEGCHKALSSGISLLDPTPTATRKGRIVRRWNLLINVTLDIAKGALHDRPNRTK